MVTFTSNHKKKYFDKINEKWQVNVCEYVANGCFKHFLFCCYPVARDFVEKRIVWVTSL